MPFNSNSNIGKISFSQEQLKNFFVEKLDLTDSSLFNGIDIENVDFQELYDVVMTSGMISDSKIQELNEELATFSDGVDGETKIDGIRDEYLIEQLSKSMDLDGDGVLSSDEFSSLYVKVENSLDVPLEYDVSDLEKALGDVGIKFDKLGLGGLKFLQAQLGKIQDTVMSNSDISSNVNIDTFLSVDDIQEVSQMLTSSDTAFSLSPDMLVGDTGKTVGDIQTEILSKQAEITDINQTTNAAIAAQQNIYDDAFASKQDNIQIFADAKAQYDYQSDALSFQIDEQSDTIAEQRGIIKDQDDIISDKKTAISDTESDIDELESKKDSTLDPIKKMEIQSRIDDLEEKLIDLKEQLQSAENKKSAAEDALSDAESAKSGLEAQQVSLDSEYNSNYSDEKLSSILAPIEKIMTDASISIDNLEETRNSQLLSVQSEILVLQLQLEGVEMAEQAKTSLGNNEIFQYNEDAGRKLAEAAMESVDEESGQMNAVTKSLQENYGASFASLNSPLEIKEALRGNTQGYEGISQHFKEMSVTKDELSNLPMGAIIVWDNGESVDNKSATSAEDLNDNIMMSLGDGKTPEMAEDLEYTVFIPV